FTLGVPDNVMGLTFLSIGVTLPDVVASLLVVRRGFGDMAVCNALGSNIFEILVGLGLPWFIQTVLLTPGKPAAVQGKGKLQLSLMHVLQAEPAHAHNGGQL
ncbi:hypothetical protein MRX96_053884, partial [Rhipicephalus microplus]